MSAVNAVPFSPLTLGELNARSRDARDQLAWTVANRVERDQPIDVEQVRVSARRLLEIHDAVQIRVPA